MTGEASKTDGAQAVTCPVVPVWQGEGSPFMSMPQKQPGARVIRYTTDTSLSSGQAEEDGARQRRAVGLSHQAPAPPHLYSVLLLWLLLLPAALQGQCCPTQ